MRTNLTSAYGLPVANADNALQIAATLGIVPWRLVERLTLVEYLTRPIDEKARKAVERFAPRPMVSFWQRPTEGDVYDAFTVEGRPWVSVYAELPNTEWPADPLVPLVFETKPAIFTTDPTQCGISVAPPSGVPNAKLQEEPGDFVKCALRVFREETGIELDSVELLAVPKDVSGRQCGQYFMPALGQVGGVFTFGHPDPQVTRSLKCILVPRSELLLLLRTTGECCTDSAVFQAFLRLGLLDHVINPA